MAGHLRQLEEEHIRERKFAVRSRVNSKMPA
jgi:hypothetical protein